MLASLSPEKGSRAIVVVALSLAAALVGMVTIPSLVKMTARREQENRIQEALTAIHYDDPEALHRVLPSAPIILPLRRFF